MRARTTTFYSFSTSITAGTTSFRLISATNLASDADGDEIEAQTQNLIPFPYAVRGQIQREVPEQLQEKVTATVFSGNMKPKKTVMAIAELMG